MEIDILEPVFDAKPLYSNIKTQRSEIVSLTKISYGPLPKNRYFGWLGDSLNQLNDFLSKLDENFINESNYLVRWPDVYKLIIIQIGVIKACDGIDKFLKNIVDGYSDSSKETIVKYINNIQKSSEVIQDLLHGFLSKKGILFKDLVTIFDADLDKNDKNTILENEIDDLEKNEVVKILESFKQELNSHLTSEINRATVFVDSQKKVIESLFSDLQNLSSIAAGKRLGEVFESNANKEEVYANKFRTYAFCLMVAVGGLLVANLYLFEKQVFTATDAYLRIAIGLFFSLVVAYLARQSAVHRSQQYMYLQKALDVTSISPYIADLPDGPRHEVKKMIAERIFVPPSQSASDGNAFITPEIFAKFLEKVDFSKKG